MNVKEESICRLCFIVAENGFDIIEETTKKILDVLLLKMNLDVSKNPIICRHCAEMVRKSYYFKLLCIDKEKFVVSNAFGKKELTFESKDLYVDNEDAKTVLKKDNICRFCTAQLEGNNFISLGGCLTDDKMFEMLPVFIPEMDLSFARNTLICTLCMENLESYFNFRRMCLDIEEKINTYLHYEGTNSMGQVNLRDILNFLVENGSGLITKCVLTSVIKQETGVSEDLNVGRKELDIIEGEKMKQEAGISRDPKRVQILEELREFDIEKQDFDIKEEGISLTKDCCKINKRLRSETISKSKIYKCPICTYETKRNYCLKSHMVTHKDATELEMYKCTTCTYETKWKRALKCHMVTHKDDAEVETYKCSVCGHVTKWKRNLKLHMLIHKDVSDSQMYHCATCTYETVRKDRLKNHMLIHKDNSTVDMYKCTICTFETTRNEYLKSHMVTHRDISEIRTYKCAICTYETKWKRNLKLHMLIHKNVSEARRYLCATCTYETINKDYLRKHMLIHKDNSEVQMHKCSICPFETRRHGYLKSHMLIHKDVSEVETYKCTICTYETKRKRNLKRHMLIHKDNSIVEV